MKKQAEQKTKGHKGTGTTGSVAPAAPRGPDPLSKDKIASLKDKNAAKMKKKR